MIFRNINKLKEVYASIQKGFVDSSEHIARLTNSIKYGSRVAIIGTGKSYGVAYRCADTANSLGLDFIALHANDLAHGSFGALANCDIAIYLSKSGKTEETVKAIMYANPLFDLEQYMLTMNKSLHLPCNVISFPLVNEMSTPKGCNLAPTTSCLLFGFVLDMLICEASDFDNDDFNIMHPGGSIGSNN